MTADEALDALDKLGKQALHVYIIKVLCHSFQVACDHCRDGVVLHHDTATVGDVQAFARAHIKCKRPKP